MMVVYSFSQINLYDQCPKKYQFRYLDWLEKEFETSPDLILWTSVHWALEWLYQQINVFNTPIKADVLWKFHELWTHEISEAWDKLIYKWDSYEDDYLRRGEHYLQAYYDKYAPFKWVSIVSTELRLNFSLWDKVSDKQFLWIIDRLDKEWDSFVINDYKTNKNLPPEDKEEYREQLTLYAYWVQQKYWKYFDWIKARLHYLHFWLVDEWIIKNEDIERVVKKYVGDINKIEKSRFDYNMWVPSAFSTKQNPYCKYCEYQNYCPLWQHLNISGDSVNWWELWEVTVKSLVDKYTNLSQEITQKTKEKDSIKELLIEYCKEKWYEQLFWTDSKISVSANDTYSIKDKESFFAFLKEKWIYDEAVDIPYYKVNSLVKEEKMTNQEINQYLEKKESWKLTPWKRKE